MISPLESGKGPWAVVREMSRTSFGDLETNSSTKDAILSENVIEKDLSQKIIVKKLTHGASEWEGLGSGITAY